MDEETLSLAGQRSATLVTNDRALFYCAKVRGVKAKWFTLISEEAAQAALLSADEAETLLMDMISAGLRARSQILAQLLIRIRRIGAATTQATKDHDAARP